MIKSFLEFVEEKEKNKSAISSKVTLGDNNDLKPFVISDDPSSEYYGSNSSLAPVVRAFKKGANWGWTKDPKTGEDKAVKISGRKLYLTGGAVRDHIVGKKPRNIELSTNASPDEIYHLLKQNEFEFTGDEDGESNKTFWVLKRDKNKRPYEFGIRVKNDIFELAVFTANPKGVDGEFKPGNQEEDAKGRDFTINALSITLSNDNGPNKELNDFFGGLYHLKNNEIVSIGDLKEKLEEEPTRALRYARMISRYGNPKNIKDSERNIISSISPKISQCDRKKVVDEFSRALNYSDSDHRGTMKIYGDLGLLDAIFPNMSLDKEFPKELKELGDKDMPIAWSLKNHMPEDIEQGMHGFDHNLIKKIIFLIKSLNIVENINEDNLLELKNNYISSGVSSRTLKNWTTKIAHKDENLINAFLEYLKLPRIKVYISEDSNQIHQDFIDLQNPFTGDLDILKVEERKKQLEHRNFIEILKKYKGK